jgi:hypothetical protein
VAKTLTAVERKAAHKAVSQVVATELPKRGLKRGAGRFRQRRAESERFSTRMYQKYLAEGGEEGTGKPFVDWLLKNLPTIIEFIMKLFA